VIVFDDSARAPISTYDKTTNIGIVGSQMVSLKDDIFDKFDIENPTPIFKKS